MALENILEQQSESTPEELDIQSTSSNQLDVDDNPLNVLSMFNTQVLEVQNSEQNYDQALLTTQETTDDPYKRIEFGSQGPTPELIELNKQISSAKDAKEVRALQKKLDDDFKNKGGFRQYALGATNAFRAGPTYEFDVYSSNYRRYKAYGDETFNKLGFNPLLNDNEDYYNRNTTGWQDWVRSTSQWGKLFKPAFTANYRSYMNFFSGDNKYDILNPDLKGAAQFEDALNIGMSSKKGFAAAATNFNLQMMYTYGIAANVVAEEIAIWAAGALLSPITGGGSLAAAGAATAVTAGQATRRFNQFRQGLQTIRAGLRATQFGAGATVLGGGWQMLKAFKNIDNARQFWTGVKAGAITASKGAVNFVNPLRATTGLIMDVRAGTVGWKNMTNFAKVSRSLGAFYRDTRENTFAVSEAQLEGGTVYLNTLDELVNDYRSKNNGEMPTGDTLKGMYETAEAAGRWQTLTNIPIIFFSNRFVFDGLFNFKGISNTVADELTKKTRKIGKYQWDLSSRSFAKNAETFLQRSKSGLKAFPALFWNYTKANFAEGIQENLQETSGAAITNYYVNTFKDPSLGGSDYLKSQIYKAADENIFSKQGMEIFLNGFLMGGPMAATSKAARWSLDKVSNLYLQKKLGKQGYADYVAEKAKTEQETVESLNNIMSDPEPFFGRRRESLVNQKNSNFQMSQAEIDENDKLYYDAKDAKTLDQIHTALENGSFPLLVDALKDMSSLSDKELAEAFNIEDGQLARQKLEGYIENATKIKSRYDFFNSKYSNPFDPAKYKKAKKPADFNQSLLYREGQITAKEYLESLKEELSETEEDNIDYADYISGKIISENPEQQAYVKEVIAYKAFEDAKKTALFAEHAFGRAVERMESVFQDLVKDRHVAKASSADFAIIQSTDNISKEIALLNQEMSTFDAETATKEQKKINRDKERKRDALIEYQKNLRNYLENKIDDTVDENGNIIIGDNTELLKPLEKSFEDYVQAIANINSDDFVVYAKAPESFKRIVDLYRLDEDAKRFLGIVNTLAIPENLYRYADGINASLTNVYKNSKYLVQRGVKDYLKIEEFSKLVSMLSQIGVRIGSEDIEPLLFDNIIPRTFYDTRNDKVIDTSDPRYELAKTFVVRFVNIQRTERGEEIIDEEQPFEEEQTPEQPPASTQPTVQLVPPTVVTQEPEKESEETTTSYDTELESLFKEAYDLYIKVNPGISVTYEEYVRDSPVIARIKEEYERQKEQAPAPPSTAATFTPTEPYGTPKGPEVVTATPTPEPVEEGYQAVVFQGYKGPLEEREFNYYAQNEREARDYGPNVRKVTVDTTGSLNTVKDKETYYKLRLEFRDKTGKNFEILDNSEEGLKTQAEFFRFLRDEKGYTGLNMLEQSDSVYFISFEKPVATATPSALQSQIDKLEKEKEQKLKEISDKEIAELNTYQDAIDYPPSHPKHKKVRDKVSPKYDEARKQVAAEYNAKRVALEGKPAEEVTPETPVTPTPTSTPREEFIKTIWPYFKVAKERQAAGEELTGEEIDILEDPIGYAKARATYEQREVAMHQKQLEEEKEKEKQDEIKKSLDRSLRYLNSWNTVVAAIEEYDAKAQAAPVIIQETTGISQAVRIVNSAKSLSELPNPKFTDKSSITTGLLELIASGEITSDEAKALVEAKRNELNDQLTINDIPLKSMITFKDGTKAFVNFKKGNNLTLKMVGSKPGQSEIRTFDQIKGNIFMIEEKKEVPVEKTEPVEIPQQDKQEIEGSKDSLKSFIEDAARIKEISNEIEKSDSTENPNEDDFFNQVGNCET